MWVGGEDSRQHGPVPATDVDQRADAIEVVGLDNVPRPTLRLPHHHVVEAPGRLDVLLQVFEKTDIEGMVKGGLAATHAMQ